MAVEREGVFKAAVEGIVAAKKAGFLVCTNTTIYKETDLRRDRSAVRLPDEARRGRLPAVAGLRLRGGAADQPGRGGRDLHDARRHPGQVQRSGEVAKKYRMMSSPVYLEFLSGKRS